MIARIQWEGIERRAGAWLVVQPLFAALSSPFEHGPLLIELGLALLAVMVAIGGESERTRERMEYLAHLPRSLWRTEVVALSTCCGVLLAVAAFHWLSEVTGALEWVVRRVFSAEPRVAWRPRTVRWPWLNLAGIPLFVYALTVLLLRRRRTARASKRPGLGQVLVSVIGSALLISVGLFFGEPIVGEPSHDRIARNVPGALGLVAGLLLLRWLALRAVTRGIDAFPEEEVAWDS